MSFRLAGPRWIGPIRPWDAARRAGRRGSPSGRWTSLMVVLLLSLSATANVLLPPSGSPSAHNGYAVPDAGLRRVFNTAGLQGPVNPFINVNQAYSQEPAPMGIADYGIGPSGAYQYSTNSSLGSVDILSLSARNSSGYPEMSMQLNVNLEFTAGGKQFVYWVQDVADVDTSSNSIVFVDNVWNSSAPNAFMDGAYVQGGGQVGQVGSSYFYYDVAGTPLPGNNVNLAYPATVNFRINSSVDASRQPVVTLEYNDGYGWQEYDSVTFTAVHQLTAMAGFVVDGFNYSPVNFLDSELIIGGAGGGSKTSDTESDLKLQLEYWNGHNYQLVTNAYNFGSDTAEGIQNAVSQWEYYPVNGGVVAELQAGAGTLGKLWDQSGVGIVDLKTAVASGTLDVRNSSDPSAAPGQYPFENGEVTVTLEPGSYEFQVYAGTSFVTSGEYTLAAGQLLQLKAPLGVVPFTLSYWVVGGGPGYSPPTLTYEYKGAVQTTPLSTTPTVYDLDAGSTWSVSSQLSGSGPTERWETGQATNGTAVAGQSLTITYYRQYLETVSYSITGGGSGYSPPTLSGEQFNVVVTLPVGTSPASFWLDSETAYSATNPLSGSTPGERWFAPLGAGSTSASATVVLAYEHQFYLAVSGGVASSQWYDSGAQATVSQPIAYDRTAGRGQRVVSYSVDSEAEVPVAPALGNVTVAVTMGSAHALAFASVVQDEVSLEGVAPQELDFVTPPTIGGDSYWYDSGSSVNVTLYGVWGRSAGEGERLASYSVDRGAQVLVGSKGAVTVLALGGISSPETISAKSTAQFFLSTASGSLYSVTPTPITGDAGWYDNQTAVEAVYNYSWSATTGQSRLNAVSYSVDGGQLSSLPRRGGGTFAISLTMGAPHKIEVTSATQYLFTLSGGFNVTLSSPSPTDDGFYDANSSTTVTSSYIGNVVPDKQRQALTGYVLDSRTVSIPQNDTGEFTTPSITFDTYHSLAFRSVGQYFVAFTFTDSSGSSRVTPTSLEVKEGGLAPQEVPGLNLWVDNGTTFTISSLLWEGADVKPLNAPAYQASAPENITVKARIYSASMKVTDLFGVAVQGAEVSARLANGTTVTRTTNSNGVATIGLIPIGTYQASVSNLGVSVSTSPDASVQSEATTTVPLSLPVLGAVFVVAALVIGSLLWRRSSRSKAPSSEPQAFPAPSRGLGESP